MKLQDLRPLVAAIVQAEEISCEVSARQARIAPAALAHVLRTQSRQEAIHAAGFRAALEWLPGVAVPPAALSSALRAFRERLLGDVQAGALGASLLGLQCVFERLACVALEPPPGELARLADRAVPLRVLVLHQEIAHRQLGDIWVGRLPDPAQGLGHHCEEYLGLAHAVLEAGLGSLDCLQQDGGHYRAAVTRELGEVRRACEAAHHTQGGR